MENLKLLKNLLQQFDLHSDVQTQVDNALNNLEIELNKLQFIIGKYELDQRINENFVKKTVALLEKSNENLSNSNQQLINTNNELLKSNEELERFAYIASHDLKTPLRTIISFSELLKRKLRNNEDNDIQKYLSFITEGGKRMHHLIEDVLEYSKLSTQDQRQHTSVISFSDVIKEITASISGYLKQKNATVNLLTPLPHFVGSHSKIFILFKNLIENGIKYNEHPTPIVKIYGKTQETTYTLYFEDNGIGIDPEYHDKIFQMFTRLHNQTQYEGSGLGLATCKKIVDEFNGNIHIESEIGIKTIFKVDFPVDIVVPSCIGIGVTIV